MPDTEATTLHVYVDTFETGTGPIVVVQFVTPVTPVIAQVPTPDGAIAPVGPATVAVNVIVLPSDPVSEFALTATVGVDFATEVVEPDVKLVAK